MAFVNEEHNLRTIDYERNIVLTRANPPLPGKWREDHFNLSWLGHNILFRALLTGKNIGQKGEAIDWFISMVDVPMIWREDENMLIHLRDLIVEALSTYGAFYGKGGASIEIRFSPALRAFAALPERAVAH